MPDELDVQSQSADPRRAGTLIQKLAVASNLLDKISL